MSYTSGSGNKHIPNQNEKRACEVCEQRVMHYVDGSIERHSVFLYEKRKGIYHKTSKKKNCDNKRWR
jgi:hypothetical protein